MCVCVCVPSLLCRKCVEVGEINALDFSSRAWVYDMFFFSFLSLFFFCLSLFRKLMAGTGRKGKEEGETVSGMRKAEILQRNFFALYVVYGYTGNIPARIG